MSHGLVALLGDNVDVKCRCVTSSNQYQPVDGEAKETGRQNLASSRKNVVCCGDGNLGNELVGLLQAQTNSIRDQEIPCFLPRFSKKERKKDKL